TASGQTPPAAHGGDVRLVSFERGLERPHFRVRQHVAGGVYSPLILVADLDGDGRDEVVVVSHEQVWAFDPGSGRQTFYVPHPPPPPPYLDQAPVATHNPPAPSPALVMITPPLPGLKAVPQDGKTFARELWKVVGGGKEAQYQKPVTAAPAGTSLVYDLDND